MKRFVCRMHPKLLGGHVHVHVRVGMVDTTFKQENATLALSGELVFTAEEWEAYRRVVLQHCWMPVPADGQSPEMLVFEDRP